MFELVIVGSIAWLFVAPAVLFGRTRNLKRDYEALKKEYAQLAARVSRLQEAQPESPAALKTQSAAHNDTRDIYKQTEEKRILPKEETTPTPLSSSSASFISAAFQTADKAQLTEPSTAEGAKEQTPAFETTPYATPTSSATLIEGLGAESNPASINPQRRAENETARTLPSSESSWLTHIYEAGKAWLLGGNMALRAGAALLFTGLAFLLRYASERFVVSVEYRYIGVVLVALALLALGWRLRRKRPSYALILQGVGIATLYLSAFAAMRLHSLLSPSEAFIILAAVTLCSVVLALAQNALGLALASALGGFAAPVLTSTGSGNHIALFSYFALLNAGIILIAWFKAWRILNLVGFVGAFGIGFAWGLRSYTPALFWSTEPFLALFFLMYVGIGLLFARRRLLDAKDALAEGERGTRLRWSASRADYIDGGLIFAPPLVGFSLQCALIEHIEFGMAFSALALGLFYFALVFILRCGKLGQMVLLAEICLALGVVFSTLAIPLALDAQWTSAAWAIEGAGVYWLGLRQSRRLARAFALFLILAAAFAYLREIDAGVHTLLSGAPLGAALLGATLLFCFRALREALPEWRSEREATNLQPILASSGLAFLYLIAPLCFDLHFTVTSWALAGLLTLFIGLKLNSRAFLHCAMGAQLLGGLVFLLSLRVGMDGNALDSGWRGLFCASSLGIALIAGAIMAQRDAWIKAQRRLSDGFGLAALSGLAFINMAALFMLDWTRVGAAWALSGLLIFWLGYAFRLRLAFYFGLFLEVLGGLAFLFGKQRWHDWHGASLDLPPLAHAYFWASATLALAAFVCAWRLHRAACLAPKAPEARRAYPYSILSGALLVWGVGWWAQTALSEIGRFFYEGFELTALAALSLSAALWAPLARFERWRALALAALLPLAAATLILLNGEGSLLTKFGVWAWPLFFFVHLLLLRLLAALLPRWALTAAHILGCWLLIGVLTISTYDLTITLSEAQNAWRWLGLALAPSLYLFLVGAKRRLSWPIAAFERAYRLYAALPIAVGLILWFWLANLSSDGASDPLPYLPLANPLELSMLLVLLSVYRWSFALSPESGRFSPFWMRGALAIGAFSLFALVTMAVCRSAYHWDMVSFYPKAFLSSMSVQAGWSLVWTLCALALMIGGNLKKSRSAWTAGAALASLVVVKLFFVELGDSGSLARVVSFIGVGVLLLIVGYFSPLPPRAETKSESA